MRNFTILVVLTALLVPLSGAAGRPETAFNRLYEIKNKEGLHYDLFPRGVYGITLKCWKRMNENINVGKTLGFTQRVTTAQHFIAVTRSEPDWNTTQGPLPTDAVMLFRPYSAQRQEKWDLLVDDDCAPPGDKSPKPLAWVVVADPKLYLISDLSYSETTELSPRGKFVKGFLNPAASGEKDAASSGANGAGNAAEQAVAAVAEAATSSALGSYKAVFKAIDTVARKALSGYEAELQELNKNGSVNLRRPAELDQGLFEVNSPFSKVQIYVERLDDLLSNPIYAFTSTFLNAWTKVEVAFPQTESINCGALNEALKAELPFLGPMDRGFLMTQLLVRAGYTKDQILRCLPCKEARELAGGIARFRRSGNLIYANDLWGKADPKTQRFSVEDLAECPSEDKDACVARVYTREETRLLHRLVADLNVLTKGANLPEYQVSDLGRVLSESFGLIDNTEAQFLGSNMAATPIDLVNALRQGKVDLFGCYTGTNTIEGFRQYMDGSHAAFLGFMGDADGVAVDSALVFRPCYDDQTDRFYRINVYKDETAARKILDDAPERWTCNNRPVRRASKKAGEQ